MSYQSLYNKYRPLTFDDMVGQESVVKVLRNSLERGRVSHAYLFTGPAGTGKTTSSRIFAKALNCKEGVGVICGECSECVGITNGTSPNVLEIDGASNGTVDTIRSVVIERIKFKPTARYRIIYIDEVHALSTSAFNALLKVLEEPETTGNDVVFIFATTNPEKIISTVLSRVQRYDLKKITIGDVVGRLRHISDEENISVTDDILFKIAKFANGGMRDAISKLDQLANFNDGEILVEDVDSVLGVVSEELLIDVVKAVIEKDIEPIIEITNDILRTGKNIDLFYNDIVNTFDTYMKISLGIDIQSQMSSNQFSSSFLTALESHKGQIQQSYVNRLIKALLDGERNIKYAPNKQLVIVNIFSDVFNHVSSSIPDLDGILSRINRLEKIIESGDFGNNTQEVRSIVSGLKDKIKSPDDISEKDMEQMEAEVAMAEIAVDNELIQFLLTKTGGQVVEENEDV